MSNKDFAYKKISELVDRFDEQFDSCNKTDYTKTQTRTDLIDPLFKMLGWER